MVNMLASDLYLNQNWDRHHGLTPAQRRVRIFGDYLASGVNGRWPYHQAAAAAVDPSELPVEIEQARPRHERTAAQALLQGQRRLWLRTDYSGKSVLDDLFEEELSDVTGEDSRRLVLEDRELYENRSWQDILLSIPEVVECYSGRQTPQDHRNSLEDAKAEVAAELENDQAATADIRSSVQHAWVTGCLWVEDQETAKTGEALLLWLDECGRIVREKRIGDIREWLGMFLSFADGESPWWHTADIGITYQDGNWP